MQRLYGRLLLLGIALFLMTKPGYTASLSLEECLRLAKERNPLLQTVRWDQVVAGETIRQAESSLYPRIDLQGGYTAQLEPQAMKINSMSLETQQAQYAFANLAITQTIYDFGRRDARRRQAEAGSNAVDDTIRQREQEVSLQVVEAFFAVLEGEKLVVTIEDELRTVEEHRRVAQALYDNGVVTRNDLLQADVRMASTRQKLLAARNRVVNLRLQLNFLTGLPAAEQQPLMEPPADLHKPDNSPDTAALKRRPDLQALRRQIESKDQEIRESQTAFYPELFARLSLDYLQNEKVREQAIYAGSVGLKVNLFDGFASSATTSKAIGARSRNQQQLRLAEEQARLEISSARNDLQVAHERIAVTREAIAQGEENLRINKSRYQERVGAATDVLDAQTLLTQVRTEHYRALYDFQVARARLKKALGEL